MKLLRKASSNSRDLAFTSFVRPILEFVSVCWDPYHSGQIRSLERIRNVAENFVTSGNPVGNGAKREPLKSRRERETMRHSQTRSGLGRNKREVIWPDVHGEK